ncbi:MULTISPECIES: hypothetical protein [Micromonospora]|uniref:hypothetical protein n=1 Tax=Micromonospora TaxID=1873 RepID=UPI0002D29A99|nr:MULTISPECIES: hypothetical protein [Micromonospora]
MTLYGWDASDYDVGRGLTTGRIRDARAAGISFMTYKGTEQSAAGTFHSQYYGVMLTAAKDAGIPFLGMYVVVHSQVTAEEQATTAIDYADDHTPGGARPVLLADRPGTLADGRRAVDGRCRGRPGVERTHRPSGRHVRLTGSVRLERVGQLSTVERQLPLSGGGGLQGRV